MPVHRVSRLSWCIVLLTVAGCRQGEPPAPGVPPLTEFPVSWAGPDCAPWDGRAISIYFGEEGADPEAGAPPLLWVYLWKDLETLAGRTWRWPPEEQVGAATWCPTEEVCEPATAAVITLDAELADSVLTGTLHLEFAGRTPVAGRFRAAWRASRVMCG